jgi:hypothetical protein
MGAPLRLRLAAFSSRNSRRRRDKALKNVGEWEVDDWRVSNIFTWALRKCASFEGERAPISDIVVRGKRVSEPRSAHKESNEILYVQ